MLIDYHTHLERGPFTLEYLRQFVTVGESRGVKEICFTEHGHLFEESWHLLGNTWPLRLERRKIRDYITLVQTAKLQGLPVRLGLEMDYIPLHEDEIRDFIKSLPLDFVLGSVHWIDGFGFDNPEWIGEWDNYNVDHLFSRYYELLNKAISSKIFDAIAHPDVIKIFGHSPSFDLSFHYEMTAQCLKTHGVCLEISTAGLRKPVGELYPHRDFIAKCLALGVDITLASDAHEPAHVGFGYKELIPYLKSIGVTQITTFRNRRKEHHNL